MAVSTVREFIDDEDRNTQQFSLSVRACIQSVDTDSGTVQSPFSAAVAPLLIERSAESSSIGACRGLDQIGPVATRPPVSRSRRPVRLAANTKSIDPR